MTPILSVLMTAFNRETFIADAIESVLASTFTDFELIIVDDCSTDGTLKIAQVYANKDIRVQVYQNLHNIGDYLNRNRAASYASGKYLKFVDSDDRIYPATLQIMIGMMEKFPSAGFGLSDIAATPNVSYPLMLDTQTAYRLHYFNKPVFFASPGQAIFLKSAFESIGGFPEKRMVGDFEMWHKMALQFPMLLMPGNLYWVRRHNGQEITEQASYLIAYERIKIQYLFGPRSPLSLQEADQIICQRRVTLFKIFLRKMAALKFREAVLRLKTLFFFLWHFKRLKSSV